MATPITVNIELAFKNDETLKQYGEKLAKDICANEITILNVIEQLGFALTSTNSDERVKGARLLSSVLVSLPKNILNAQEIEYLASYCKERFGDHHSTIPATIDCVNALIQMNNFNGTYVPSILQSFFQHTTCQSQARNDRTKLFHLFNYLTKHFQKELVDMSGDFLYGLINSIDGERDPRNLDFIFSFMPDFIASYPLLHLGEELFEIFACYFPIDFNPMKNEAETITRDSLAVKLANCLVATPEFAEWAVVLAVEKMESTLIVAKLDSIELLRQAALKFPPKVLEPYFLQVWAALKNEIFPGSENAEIIRAALRTLTTLLERANNVPELSQNYQTTILGTVLPHLSDVNQCLFNPAVAIALVCVSGDAPYAADKILHSFLLKLKSENDNTMTGNADIEQRIKIYNIIAQVYKLASLREALHVLNTEYAADIQSEMISTLRLIEKADFNLDVLDLQRAALGVLNECVPIISESHRAMIYKVLVQLVIHATIDLDFKSLLILLGALYPIELQTNFIDICMRNFALFSNFVKRKIYANLLSLIPQIAFTQRIQDFILLHVFKKDTPTDTRILALKALNDLLAQEDKKFIIELQQNNDLIEKLIALAKETPIELSVLVQIATTLNRIIQQLDVAEQYTIVTQYLPKLDLQLAADLYVAKGLLGYLHQDISLDDHFERLLDDLTSIAASSNDSQLRAVAHHLLCGIVNKTDHNENNRKALTKLIATLKAAVKSGEKIAVETLAWLAKGLVTSGHNEAADIVESLADLLDHPTLGNAATLAFEIISAEHVELHLPVAKILYKQKFFHMILSKLGHKLESYCEHHLNAFIYVIKTTPHKVLQMNLEQLGPILFKTLDTNQPHTLCTALHICERFVKHEDVYFRTHLNHLIPSCLKLCKYKNSMHVRISALNLLYDITKYPTYALLQYKVDVGLELAATLDDPKRLVRNVAVKTRNAWYLIGAPSSK